MAVEQYTYWSLTLNNPTEADMVIVRNPNDKYVRKFVWTPEQGEDGTPHIQGWLRLQRNQTLTFVKKLYPRAHLKPLKKDEYNENTHRYAQKDDATTRGVHTLTMNDPMPSVESVIEAIMLRMMTTPDTPLYLNKQNPTRHSVDDSAFSKQERRWVEEEMVIEKGTSYAKLFVSPVYGRIWDEFARQIYLHLRDKQCPESDS